MLDLFAQITTRFRHSSPCLKMEGHVWKAIHSKNPWMWLKIVSILCVHCKVIIGRNPIEANANTVAIQLLGNPVAYIGKCFTPY